MNCAEYERQLGEYVDGALPPAAIPPVEAHLAACARCRVVLADLDAIRSLARSLEAHTPPPRVWQTLSAELSRPQRRTLRSMFVFGWQPAAAAAAALLLTSSLWWVGDRLAALAPVSGELTVASQPLDSRGSLGAGPVDSRGSLGAAAAASPAAEEARVPGEAQYTTAIATLEEAASVQRDTLDAGTASELDAGLDVIDHAIAESRTALDSDPGNEVAQESLFQALRQKVELLQFTLALVNEMRKGNEDGAARVISELNQ